MQLQGPQSVLQSLSSLWCTCVSLKRAFPVPSSGDGLFPVLKSGLDHGTCPANVVQVEAWPAPVHTAPPFLAVEDSACSKPKLTVLNAWQANQLRKIHFAGVWMLGSSIEQRGEGEEVNWKRWSVQFSHSVVPDSLRPHESQHTRPPCPSPAPVVHPNPRPSSRWCHPAISSSVVPFSSCPQSLPASGSFPVSQLFPWGGHSIGVSASASVISCSKLFPDSSQTPEGVC